MDTSTFGPGIEILGPITSEYSEILTPEAIAFVARLDRMFGARRRELLERRAARQRELDAGKMPDFLAETAHIRNDPAWRVAPVTNGDLQDRRVEITGPVDRKMVINALNCGAATFMADFEDANTPTWTNQIDGQVNLRDAVRRTIGFVNEAGREYRLNDRTATLIVRPRGWHLPEKHMRVDGQPVSGGRVHMTGPARGLAGIGTPSQQPGDGSGEHVAAARGRQSAVSRADPPDPAAGVGDDALAGHHRPVARGDLGHVGLSPVQVATQQPRCLFGVRRQD